MKVISGLLKGREILGFHNPGTRPTMDRVKESLFAMIQEDVSESVGLDLFSGSGNLAIEALSQGARFIYANDHNREAYKIILKNRERFSLEKAMEVTNYDFKTLLSKFHEEGLSFDLIFLDPPYQTNYIEISLALIQKYQLLKQGGKIICETDSLSKIPESTLFSVVKTRKYGDKFVVILE